MVALARDIETLRRQVARWREAGLSVALVPTMGALHEGHLALIDVALANADRAVVSVFVNPTQFAPNEDFNRYPRALDDDVAAVEARGGHLVFAPPNGEVYRDGFNTRVRVGGVGEGLEETDRPGFLAGVATVVTKLLLQCGPDSAIFGEKDYQQLLVVRKLVLDLDIPVRILSCPTVRDECGLALSSRNAYLSKEKLQVARQLNVVLREVGEGIYSGKAVADVLARGKNRLTKEGFDKIGYLEMRDGESLEAIGTPVPAISHARLLAAAWLGDVRLIDNIAINLQAEPR